ncbi:hypothetical protein CYY_000669 [Polysphondylium violaceum]|uniref:Uncharacterized protein n=1 Tax=Polysphondylium violaceum TaxID=133409 RepID=A0A8J4UWY8_9MYCE|nr:hypothetical protein CYY_000669 [Polysphondylium violaceum]
MSNPYGSPAVPQGNYNLGSPAIAVPNPSTPSTNIYTPNSTPHQNMPVQNTSKPLAALSPLPSSSLFAQNLIKVEDKVQQLQVLNNEIYALLNSCISPTGSTAPLAPPTADPLLSGASSSATNNTIQLVYEKKARVQEIIKSLSQDIIQNNLYFLIPILNDPSLESILFAADDVPLASDAAIEQPTPTPTPSPHPNAKLDASALQQKIFLEKFQHHLTPEVIGTQSNQWDSLSKERDKLIKNTDRSKSTLLNKIK